MDSKNLKEKLILDVGSGSLKGHVARGNVCIDVVKRPYHVPNVFICADAHNLPFSDNVFDEVMFYHVIEHLADPTNCLKEIYRVLKFDGCVNISVPNMYHYRKLWKIVRGKYPHDDTFDHISCWTPWELGNLLRINNFKDISFGYYNFSESHRKKLDKIAAKIMPKIVGHLHLFAKGVKKAIVWLDAKEVPLPLN